MRRLHSNIKTALTGIILVCPLIAFSADSYPEAALRDAYEKEVTEKIRMEELERRVAREKSEYEARVRDIEQQIDSKKLQTENYKMKSEQLLGELETLNVELFELRTSNTATQEEIKKNEERYQAAQQEYDKASKDHTELKVSLEAKQQDLGTLRQKVETKIAAYKIEMEKMRQDISVIEAEIAAADAKRAELDTAEMQTRVEWLAVKKENDDKRELKAKYQADAEESKRKLAVARQDLSKAQSELSKMSADVARQTQAARNDIQKYEREMVEISRKKAMAEAEKIRVESESDKLKRYVDQVKQARDSNNKNLEESQSALIQSRLALESVKTDLTKVVAADQKQEFENQKVESRIRGLASAAEASEILDGGRLFVTTMNCPSYRRPASQSPEAYQIEPGRKLLARESIGSWVKITSEGKSVYVDKKCGRFEDK